MTLNQVSNQNGKSRACKTGTNLLPITFAVAMLFQATAWAVIYPNSPSTGWVPIAYPNSFPDPASDQQTGSAEADLVGNSSNPSLYMKYDGTDGSWGFRMRVGADTGPSGFNGAALIGLDVNLDGQLDVFVGVNNQGSGSYVGIWNPGTGLNTSPSTTSIVSPPIQSYRTTAAFYSFSPIDAIMDPLATSFDLNADGRTDQFLTFALPFSDLVAVLVARGIPFSADTPVTMLAATATQDNSLNQDVNGADGSSNSKKTWAQLGAVSLPYSANGLAPVPEPSQFSLMCVAGLGMLFAVKSRRQK